MIPLYLEGMSGLGDCIYQTPIVLSLCEKRPVYLRTPWPQLYDGIRPENLHFIDPKTKLRTQAKSAAVCSSYYGKEPCNGYRMRWNYVSAHNEGTPIYKALCEKTQVNPVDYHLSLRPACSILDRRPLVVIRPATLRTEWLAASRSPKQIYIQRAIDRCNAAGLETIVVADIAPPAEVYDEFRPIGASRYYENGELSISQVMDLTHQASFVVSGVGFMAPLCIALGTPALIIHGGAGGWNAPELIDCPGEGTLTHLLPDNYCRCKDHRHACSKTISDSNFNTKINELLEIYS